MLRLSLLSLILVAFLSVPAQSADALGVAGTSWDVKLTGPNGKAVEDKLTFTDTEAKCPSFGTLTWKATGNKKRTDVTGTLVNAAGDTVTLRVVITDGKSISGFVELKPKDTSAIIRRVDLTGVKTGTANGDGKGKGNNQPPKAPGGLKDVF